VVQENADRMANRGRALLRSLRVGGPVGLRMNAPAATPEATASKTHVSYYEVF